MRRLTAVAVLAFATASLWPSAAAAPALTPRNSVVASLRVRDSIGIDGVGCGVPASATLALPAGAFDVQVKQPLVGARDVDAQLTGVAAQGNGVTFTAVADSARVCDPNADTTPPANRPWSADFDVDAGFKERVMVVLWNVFPLRGKAFAVRPSQVRIGIVGAARHIRWKQFGGRTAIGVGAFKSVTPCAGGCTDNGTRLTVKLDAAGPLPRREPARSQRGRRVLREGGVRPSRAAGRARARTGMDQHQAELSARRHARRGPLSSVRDEDCRLALAGRDEVRNGRCGGRRSGER
jgi:hypothetical protein